MHVLLLCIAVVGFFVATLSMKLGTRRQLSINSLMFSLFIVASLCSLTMLWSHPGSFSWRLIVYGVVGGLTGSIAFFLYSYAITLGSYGTLTAVFNASFLVPVLYAVLVLRQPCSWQMAVGIMMVVVALFFAAGSGQASSAEKPVCPAITWFALVGGIALLNGLTQVLQLLSSRVAQTNAPLFQSTSYLTGAVLFAIIVLRQRAYTVKSLPFGIWSAVGSMMGVYGTLFALSRLPAGLVFPVTLSLPIVLASILSMVVFKERLTVPALCAIGGIIAGLVLLTMK